MGGYGELSTSTTRRHQRYSDRLMYKRPRILTRAFAKTGLLPRRITICPYPSMEILEANNPYFPNTQSNFGLKNIRSKYSFRKENTSPPLTQYPLSTGLYKSDYCHGGNTYSPASSRAWHSSCSTKHAATQLQDQLRRVEVDAWKESRALPQNWHSISSSKASLVIS